FGLNLLFPDCGFDRVESGQGRRFDVLDLHDVKPETRLDRAADGVFLRREDEILEWLHHEASGDPAEIAAVRARARIDASLCRELREVGTGRRVAKDEVGV